MSEVETEEPPCTLNEGDIWCGVVDVEEVRSTADVLTGHGFVGITGRETGGLAGHPDDTMFSVGDNDYTIQGIYVGTGTNNEGALFFLLNADLSDDDEGILVLAFDGVTTLRPLDDATKLSTGLYHWSTDLDWSSTTEVTVRLQTPSDDADDPPVTLPTLSIADAAGDEDEGVEFTATLTAGVSGKVTATWTATIESDDTAVAADLATMKTGDVEFAENATSAKFTVPVNADTIDEDNETFTVTLSGVSENAQLAADPTAKGTINDDDASDDCCEVDVGGSAMGTGGTLDRDWFRVVLEAGTRYQIDVEGADTGRGTLENPAAALFDTSSTNLGANDDGGVGENARLIYTPTASGTYYVQASNVSTVDEGTYTLSMIVLGANGASEADTDFPETTATSGRVEVGASVTGTIGADNDDDWFRVDLEAGKTYQFDLEGADTGRGTQPDPYVALNNPSATTELGFDSDGGVGKNARLIYTAAATGTHYVDAATGSDERGTYTLSVRDITPSDDLPADTTTTGTVEVDGSAVRGDIYEPVEETVTWTIIDAEGDEVEKEGTVYDFDTDWFAVDLKAGRTYRIDMKGETPDDDLTLHLPEIHAIYDADGVDLPNTSSRDATDDANNSHHLARVEFTPEDDGTYYIAASGESFEWGDYELTVIDITQDDDEHPADRSTTVIVIVGTPVTGKIDFNRDVDWFKLLISVEDRYQIDLEGQETGSGSLRDPLLLGVYDADGNYISGTRNDDGGEGYNARISRTLKVGIYYVAVGAFGNGEGTYTLTVVY